MEPRSSLDHRDAINPLTEKPAPVRLGTSIAARFVNIGLDQPLPEVHLEIDRLPPAISIQCQADAQA